MFERARKRVAASLGGSRPFGHVPLTTSHLTHLCRQKFADTHPTPFVGDRHLALYPSVHRVALCLNFFSNSPKPTLGRKRYTGCAISCTSHAYFFSYALAKLLKPGCCA